MNTLDISFENALKYVNEGSDSSKFSNDLKLKLYGLYKRITVGRCSQMGTSRPFFLNKVATSKYDSWLSFDNLEVDKCKELYVSIIKEFSRLD